LPDSYQLTLLFASITLLTVMLLRLAPALITARGLYAFGLVLCSQAYLVSWVFNSSEMPRSIRVSLLALVVAQPVFFWLTANSLFEDRFRLKWWHALAIAGKFVVAGFIAYNRPLTNVFAAYSAEELPRLLPNFFYTLAFVFHALAVVLRTNRNDLVEPRRRLRAYVLVGTAVIIVHALLSAAVLRPLNFGSISDMISLAVIFGGALLTVTWGDVLWRDMFTVREKSASVLNEADHTVVAKALAAMETDELFRTEGLTVSALATKLGVQEYKLRRAINNGLGYRNFNEYLNFYRMRAAKKFLETAENSAYPLIHLALDLGYPSPAPFNRAFKEATGISPGEYRRRSQGGK
jgi:AraC-like DNA-binding protein